MIISVTIANFKSFRDPTTLSFVAGTTSKLAGNLIRGASKDRIIKALALYGPNASGKTTVLDALYALRRFVLFSSQDQKPTAHVPHFEPFALDAQDARKAAEISITFEIGNERYAFTAAATPDRVWREKLLVQKSQRRARQPSPFIVLIDRSWDADSERYSVTLGDALAPPATLVAASEQTTPNRLMLGKLASLNSEAATKILQWFEDDLGFYDMHRNRFSEDAMLGETARILKKDEKFAVQIARLISDADTGIQELRVTDERVFEAVSVEGDQKFEVKDKTRPTLAFQHTTEDGSEVVLRRQKESSGTLRFVALLTAILKPSKRRRLICVDEISASLHPDLVKRLMNIIHSRAFNPLGHQVLFSTHDTHLIDPDRLLRRDQVAICRKDRFGRSSIVRLDAFQDAARSDANLQKQYLQGRFGGTPNFGPTLEDIPEDDSPLEVHS